MNLHQFRFVQEAARRNLNLTEAAKALHTSQPGVSKAIIELASELEGIRILVAEENAAGFYKDAKSKINTKEYEVLMTVRDKDETNVDFLIKDDGNKMINELLLLVGGEDEFVLMSFVGKIDLDKVSKLINEFDDEGETPSQEQKQ